MFQSVQHCIIIICLRYCNEDNIFNIQWLAEVGVVLQNTYNINIVILPSLGLTKNVSVFFFGYKAQFDVENLLYSSF